MIGKKVWLIGAGTMAVDYLKVLRALGADVTVVGRGRESAERFAAATGCVVVPGGLDGFLAGGPAAPDAAIVSVGVEQLAATARSLLAHGVTDILLEKPGAVSVSEIRTLSDAAEERGVDIPLAYNRRFFSSVSTARKMIREDGGARSFSFEFTEWAHEIEKLEKPREVLANWFLANSSHVADLAFFLGGDPAELHCHVRGSLSWHPSGAVFTGSGVTDRDIPFSYHADWGAPGRWSVEIMTSRRRYIFRPMEKLQVQALASVAVDFVPLDDDQIDADFKPGLYRQTEAFLAGRLENFRLLSSQAALAEAYGKMAGYTLS